MRLMHRLLGIAATIGSLSNIAAALPTYEAIDGGESVVSLYSSNVVIAPNGVVAIRSSDGVEPFLIHSFVSYGGQVSSSPVTLIATRQPNQSTALVQAPAVATLNSLGPTQLQVPFVAVATTGTAVGSAPIEPGVSSSFLYSVVNNTYTELAKRLGTATTASAGTKAYDISRNGARIAGETRYNDTCVTAGGIVGHQQAVTWASSGAIEFVLGNAPIFSTGQTCGVPTYLQSATLDLSPDGRLALVGAGTGTGWTRLVVFDLSSGTPAVLRDLDLSQMGLGSYAQATKAFITNSGVLLLDILNYTNNPTLVVDSLGSLSVPTPPNSTCTTTSFDQRANYAIVAATCAPLGNPYIKEAKFILFDTVTRTMSQLSMNRIFPGLDIAATQAEYQGFAVDEINGVARITH